MDRRRILVIAAAVVAALGAVLVLLYVQGADQRAEAKYQLRTVLTATQQIGAGESFDAASQSGKITATQVVSGDAVPDALAQSDAGALQGKVALAPIYPGQQIVTAQFGDKTLAQAPSNLPIPDKDVAVSVTLTDSARVAGYVEPGSQVAVFLNGSDDTGKTFTRLLLPKVLVLGVGSTPAAGASTPSTGGDQGDQGDQSGQDGTGDAPAETLPNTLITLAVTQQQAAKVLFAQQNGDLAFVLLTGSSDVKPGPATDLGNLFD
jgi:pilus assembly protein CpaB